MSTANETTYRGSCQAATPAECSQCTASYDCELARTGRTLSWGFVLLGILLVVGLIATAIG